MSIIFEFKIILIIIRAFGNSLALSYILLTDLLKIYVEWKIRAGLLYCESDSTIW